MAPEAAQSQSNWDPRGLEKLAILIDITASSAFSDQDELSKASGVAVKTVGLLRLNKEDHTRLSPEKEIIEKLALHIIDPRTGEPFTPKGLIAVCKSGELTLGKGQWDPKGLARFAELIRITIQTAFSSQNDFAVSAGVSSSTLGVLKDNTEDHVVREPDDATLSRLAVHMTNPRTGEFFTPKELIDLCKGYYPLGSDKHSNLRQYINHYCVKAGSTVESIAKSMGLTFEELNEFIDKDPAERKVVTPREMAIALFLGSATGNTLYLASLAGFDVAGI